MLFNLFGESKQEKKSFFKDKVYISNSAKMNACLQLAIMQPHTLFIAWFADTAKKSGEFFKQHGYENINIAEAGNLRPDNLKDHVPVFLEHYPLHQKELALVQQWPQQTTVVYSAMDEPLFKQLGSDKMIPLIKLLGMKENEAIEHSFVTQSIIKGQQKIADKVTVDQPADSQSEWMRKNFID